MPVLGVGMQTLGGGQLQALDDGTLESSLRALLSTGRRTEASIVAHLAEIEARRGHLRAGKSSMFAYCVECLGLSEAEAFNRITAARLSRRYPVLLEMLASGRLHLSAICAARFYLSDDNHAELLEAIAGKSKRKVEELLAARYPSMRVPERLSRLPRLKPVAADRFLLELTIDGGLKADLELARDLLRHANPEADFTFVIQRAASQMLQRLRASRFGELRRLPNAGTAGDGMRETAADDTDTVRRDAGAKAARPKGEGSEGTSRAADCLRAMHRGPGKRRGKRAHLPRSVRRAVVTRDGVGCSFVGTDGQRCGSCSFLEFHHVESWATGGEDNVENLRLYCAAHNRWAAEQELGASQIAEAIERRRAEQR